MWWHRTWTNRVLIIGSNRLCIRLKCPSTPNVSIFTVYSVCFSGAPPRDCRVFTKPIVRKRYRHPDITDYWQTNYNRLMRDEQSKLILFIYIHLTVTLKGRKSYWHVLTDFWQIDKNIVFRLNSGTKWFIGYTWWNKHCSKQTRTNCQPTTFTSNYNTVSNVISRHLPGSTRRFWSDIYD